MVQSKRLALDALPNDAQDWATEDVIISYIEKQSEFMSYRGTYIRYRFHPECYFILASIDICHARSLNPGGQRRDKETSSVG